MAGKYVWIKLIGLGGEKLEVEPRWWPAEELCHFSNSSASELLEKSSHQLLVPKIQLIDLALAGGIVSLDRAEVGVHEWESGY